MWLQDVHSLCPLNVEGVESNVLLSPDGPASPVRSAPHRSTVRVGEFEVAMGGGIWVAIRVRFLPATPEQTSVGTLARANASVFLAGRNTAWETNAVCGAPRVSRALRALSDAHLHRLPRLSTAGGQVDTLQRRHLLVVDATGLPKPRDRHAGTRLTWDARRGLPESPWWLADASLPHLTFLLRTPWPPGARLLRCAGPCQYL